MPSLDQLAVSVTAAAVKDGLVLADGLVLEASRGDVLDGGDQRAPTPGGPARGHAAVDFNQFNA